MNPKIPIFDPPPLAARKLRLAVVGATYASEEPRKKIESLAEHFDLVCITSSRYTGTGWKTAWQTSPNQLRTGSLD